ncbi:MAG: Hsp70 family protein [Armatimonadota bacterium]
MATVYAIGIDFGTANSCVAFASYFDRGNGEVDPDPLHRPEVVPFHNRDTVPTCLHLGDGKTQPPTFGLPAEERATFDPARFFTGFKLQLGDTERGRDAFLMAKYFMGYLRRRIGQFVPIDSKDPNIRVETIVGHPVQWNADQREATLRAAQEAGFPNVRLEEESLAALYCHVFDERTGFQPKPGSHVLTVDMGGGTTDFAFLQIPETPEERPVSIPVHPETEMARSYGGRHLDFILFQYLSRNWDPEVVKTHQRLLLREVRRFKEAFSNNLSDGAMHYETMILAGEKNYHVRLSRDEFERVAAEYIGYFEKLVTAALQEAGLRPDQVAQLILTGGHSRWYFVERALGKIFPHLFVGTHTIFRHSHPEQSVARGLAYDPLVRTSRGGFVAPLRRAAHPVWLHIPGSHAARNGTSTPVEEPMLLLPRGQLLPFNTQPPVKIQVDQVAADPHETRVKIQFLTGHQKVPLADRIATFQRGFWEQVANSLAGKLLRAGGAKRDRFEVEVHFNVDEHELITAEMVVTRFLGNKPAEVQRKQMQVSVQEAMGRSLDAL